MKPSNSVVPDRSKNENEALRLVVTTEPGREGFELLNPEVEVQEKKWEVIINPPVPIEADFWIVFGNARPVDRMFVAPQNTLLIVQEPEEKKIYPKKYYRQFNNLVDTHSKSGHPRCELHAPCFDWHVGIDHSIKAYRYGYQYLVSLPRPHTFKNKISVVCSDARRTKGQIERLEFLEALKGLIGERIDHFGRGFNPVRDKMDAIYGYRAHLVLENCSAPHYWTEKLADAYLGWAYPVYYGCPNVLDYFPEQSIAQLHSLDPSRAAQIVQQILDGPDEDPAHFDVSVARNLVLNQFNPFSAWIRWADERYVGDLPRKWVTLRSHKAYRPFPMNLIFRAKHGLHLSG